VWCSECWRGSEARRGGALWRAAPRRDHFFVLFRAAPERVDFARVVFARAVAPLAEGPRVPLELLRPAALVAFAVSAAVARLAAALPTALAALPAADTAALPSLSMRPAARFAWPADCSAFFACRVAAAFFAAADLCALVCAISLPPFPTPERALYTRRRSRSRARCPCGSLIYTCDAEPLASANCHYKQCQKSTGSAFSTGVAVPADAVQMTGDTPGIFEMSSEETGLSGLCHFCTNCGSPLMTKSGGAHSSLTSRRAR